jgi:hypothetical protein
VTMFLPFAAHARRDEERAIELKADFGYGPYEAVDPWEFAERLGIELLDSGQLIELLDRRHADHLTGVGRARWSAGTIEMGDRTLTILNALHSPARQTATLMEELVHVILGHPVSRLEMRGGLAVRTCAHDVEDEAFRLGAALVIPYRDLFNWLNWGRPLETFPTVVEVSSGYLEFRVKRAGLWRLHRARARSAI